MSTDWRMTGHYFKNCNCATGCPCDFWAPPTRGFCEGCLAMRVTRGHFGSTPLEGQTWAVTFAWPGPLHLGNGTVQPYVDPRATDAQREALLTILSGQAGGPWFQLVASLTSTLLPPKFVPIEFDYDATSRRVRVRIADEVEVASEPIRDINGKEQQMRIELPEGVEYRTADVIRATRLRSTSGRVAFDYEGVHSSLSEVTHTPAGLA